MRQLLSTIVFLLIVALAAGIYFFFSKKTDKLFTIDYAKYEALAKDHPAGESVIERLKQNAELLEDDNPENDADGYLGVAFFIRQLGDNKDAILAYKEALKLQPKNTLALNNIATSYRDMGDYKNAEVFYRKIVEISPGNVTAYRNLADVYLYLHPDDEEGLLEILEPGISSALNPGGILSYLAVFYRDRGEYRKAVEYLEEFLRYNPDSIPVRNEIEELRNKL